MKVHEMAIVSNMLSVIESNAEENKMEKVKRVKVVIGELSGVVIDSLEFCWQISTENTFMEDAEFVVEKKPALALCSKCGGEYKFSEEFCCPQCGGAVQDIVSGKELYVDYIEGE